MNPIYQHLFIVISGDTGNALGVIRSLGEAGIKPVLIYLVEKSRLPVLIKSRYLDVIHKVHSYEEGVDLLLEKYKGNTLKPFVYTCDDSIESILDNRYDELKESFFFFNAGKQGLINHMMNKKVICDIAESCGFRVPKNEVVKRGDMPASLAYPVITKTLMSIWGVWKADSYICQNEDDLRAAYEKIKATDLILEEYVDKKNELALEGFSINGGKDVYIPYGISFFRSNPGCYGHYMWCRLMENNDLMTRFQHIIQKCHYEGCFEMEFLVDKNNDLWFLEVNFRYSFWNYAVTYGGLNYPMMWAESTLSGRIISPEESLFSSCPIRTYFTALNEPGDFGQSVVSGRLSFWKWLSDIRKADMLFFYNPYDKRPAWSFWTHKFLRKLGGLWSRK